MFETANGPVLAAYIAKEKFSPQNGESWNKYIEWSKLEHVSEIISLDNILCQKTVTELIDEDWGHNVHEDFKLDLFWDLAYLLKRVAGVPNLNILAVIQQPAAHAASLFHDSKFEFIGYDLIEMETSISALTNCGGLDLAFAPTDLSPFGLLTDFEQTKKVQPLLLERYPNEHHAHCDVWAIWRMHDPQI